MVRYILANEYPSEANNGPSFSPLKVKRAGENNISMTDRSIDKLWTSVQAGPEAHGSIQVHLLKSLSNMILSLSLQVKNI